jgi:hypothetical protein
MLRRNHSQRTYGLFDEALNLTDILWIQQLLMQSHNLEPFSESQLVDLFREVKEIRLNYESPLFGCFPP